MANNQELKTHVDETAHDDFLIAARLLGFNNRSEYLRYLVMRELYGVQAQLHINKMPGAATGPKE